jgi:hypothetical protein
MLAAMTRFDWLLGTALAPAATLALLYTLDAASKATGADSIHPLPVLLVPAISAGILAARRRPARTIFGVLALSIGVTVAALVVWFLVVYALGGADG